MVLCLYELCFSLVPPLWELCCSLAPSDEGAVLGNASGEGGVLKEELLVPLSLFSPLFPSLLSLSLLSSPFPSPFPSRSHSFFFSFSSFFSFSFSFSFPFALSLLLFPSPFLFLEIFPVFEGTVCTVHSRDVRDGTTDCNQLYLYWNKEQYLFLKHESVYSEVCNFLGCYLAEMSAFFFFFFTGMPRFLIHNQRTHRLLS